MWTLSDLQTSVPSEKDVGRIGATNALSCSVLFLSRCFKTLYFLALVRFSVSHNSRFVNCSYAPLELLASCFLVAKATAVDAECVPI